MFNRPGSTVLGLLAPHTVHTFANLHGRALEKAHFSTETRARFNKKFSQETQAATELTLSCMHTDPADESHNNNTAGS
jgi:hypothetical protein